MVTGTSGQLRPTPPPEPEGQHSRAAEPNGPPSGAAGIGFEPFLVAFALFFVVVTAAGLVIGLHDVALADADLTLTVTSVLLLAVAAMLVVAASQLLRLSRRADWEGGRRPPCKPPVLIAFLLVLFGGLYAFLSGLRATGDQRLLVAAAGLILLGIGVVGLVAFLSEVRVTAPRVGALALGLVGATLSAWQFWYQNEYAPSQVGRAISLSATLAREARQPQSDVIRATVNYQAVTGRSLAVVGSAYTLTGSRVVTCDRRSQADATEVAQVFKGFLIDPQRSRFSADVREQQPSRVLYAGKFVGDGRRLEAEVPYVRQIVFHVPRGRYQLLRFRAQMFAISGAIDLSQAQPPEYELAADGYLYGFWHVDDNSWLRDLIYGRERWLVTRYELVREPGNAKVQPDLRVTARLTDGTWKHGRPALEEAASLFTTLRLTDPAEPFATTELALEPLAAPSAKDSLPRACSG